MAGEMIYIIDQRLQAQKIGPGKSNRVLNDIILSVFNSKLICEVFKPHNAITFYVLRTIFEKLVHSSIMRLNEQSMNKLFDLMIMVIKYQLFACPKPSDIITITDNHLLSIIEMINNKDNHKNNHRQKSQICPTIQENNTLEIVNLVRNQFLFHYQNYDLIQFQYIRYDLLNFLKDIRTRVSIFLREGTQTNDGIFIIPFTTVQVECECQIPGVVRYFRGSYNEIIKTEHFDVGGQYVIDESRTKLGLNIYKKENDHKQQTKDDQSSQLRDGTANQKEMDLLAKLICKTPKPEDGHSDMLEFKFDFLSAMDKQEDPSKSNEKNDDNTSVQVIDSRSSDDNEQLIRIIQDLNEFSLSNNGQQQSSTSSDDQNANNPNQSSDTNDEIDLLELMDS